MIGHFSLKSSVARLKTLALPKVSCLNTFGSGGDISDPARAGSYPGPQSRAA